MSHLLRAAVAAHSKQDQGEYWQLLSSVASGVLKRDSYRATNVLRNVIATAVALTQQAKQHEIIIPYEWYRENCKQ